MAQPYQSGNKTVSWADSTKNIFAGTPGIYKGVVKKLDTATRSGRLFVYIDEITTATSNDPSGWILVDYASPFMGRTLGPAVRGAAVNIQNDFNNTQQSYGFFMSPPDVGNYVLCCFPANDYQSGYWFACLSTSLGKQMIPSIGSLPLNRVDPSSVPQDLLTFIKPGYNYPVGEFNENDKRVYVSNWATATLKPLHVPQYIRLIRQGLDTDANGRGTISSSVQRDGISSVFGFSTPGRPTNDPANDPALQEKLTTGEFDPQEFIARNRVGGHSLTMDDGDLYGKNNLVKLRTSAGHQILMNDTPGDEFLYIANSNGTAWIELTKEGDVLVYGQRDLSIRTRGNLMMHSDRLIQMNARGPIQMKSAALQIENTATSINSDSAVSVFAKSINLQGLSGINLFGQKVGIAGLGGIKIDGSTVDINSGKTPKPSLPPQGLNDYALPDTTFVQGYGWTAVDGQLRSINYRVPTHEPYIRGNVAALIEQQQAIDSESQSTERTVDGNLENQIRPTNLAPGIDRAQILGVESGRSAPTSAFISQPKQSRTLGVLDSTDLRAYFAQTGFTQSNSQYNVIDDDGALGKYKLSPGSLISLGYMKPDAPRTLEAVDNSLYWTGLNGINSALDFRINGSVQEVAMYNFTKRNYSSLQNFGLISDETAKDTVVGLLSASHFAGTEAVAVWAKNDIDFIPGYGNAIAEYFNQGRYSQTQVPILTQSEESIAITSVAPTTNFES